MNVKQFLILGGMAILTSLMSSCEKIHDEAQGCGLYLDFKYDYNMEYADAFHSQVKKVDVYVFDRDSNFLFKQSADGAQLADKRYRMRLNVPIGEEKNFIVMAWAGAVDNFVTELGDKKPKTIKELKLKMQQQENGINNTDLGNLWYGEIRDVDYLAQEEQTETINLIKDTNRFRIILQKVGEGESISVKDLSIRLLTDNSYYNYKNEIIPTHTVGYMPYFTNDIEGVGAVAELNTMRLLKDNPVKLIIRDNTQNRDLLNVDLMQYLLATQMEGRKMTAQEYLDRQSEFTIILFYNENNEQGAFLSAKIIINDWTLWMHGTDI